MSSWGDVFRSLVSFGGALLIGAGVLLLVLWVLQKMSEMEDDK